MNTTIEKYLNNHSTFTTSEFAEALRAETPTIGRSTIYDILNKLCQDGKLSRSSRGVYTSNVKKEYSYELSETARRVSATISKEYPLVDFQVWELYQMNEFVNHLISRNTVFVDAENILDETVFELLFSKYSHVLHRPYEGEYYKYAGDETIVVQQLISEAPTCYDDLHQAPLEKILVDLFSHGVVGKIINHSEYRAIYEDAFGKYRINQPKLFRYARRRGVEQTIKEFILKETDITLEVSK